MLPTELSKTRYDETRFHLGRLPFWHTRKEGKDSATSDKLDASLAKLSFQEAEVDAFFNELLQSTSTMLKEIAEQDEGEMSALLDGCMLAMSLQSLETQDGWTNDKKWEMISQVWVDMLVHAASHCGWKVQADALAQGGELLTHVCLLMAHLGLSFQCRPEESDQLDARSKRLDDIYLAL
ncbi:hypothetical protein H0E87_013647, partial [Populus deltoides]